MSFTFPAKGNGGLFFVPNAVVDRYLSQASHSQLKVLLYLLRRTDAFTADEACEAIQVSLSEFEAAVNFWASAGVLQTKAENVLLRYDTLCPDSVRKPEEIALTALPTYSFEEISKIVDNSRSLKSLFQSVPRIFNKTMGNAQTKNLFALHDHYGFPPETIFTMAKYCVENNKATYKALFETAQDWYRMGLVSEEAALTYAEQQRKLRSEEYMLRKLFGIGERGLSTSEKRMFHTWLAEYNFSEDMLRLAYDRCVDSKQKYLPKYIDSILRSWFEKGFKTPEQAASESAPELPKSSRKRKAESEATFDAEEFVSWSFQQVYGEKEGSGE